MSSLTAARLSWASPLAFPLSWMLPTGRLPRSCPLPSVMTMRQARWSRRSHSLRRQQPTAGTRSRVRRRCRVPRFRFWVRMARLDDRGSAVEMLIADLAELSRVLAARLSDAARAVAGEDAAACRIAASYAGQIAALTTRNRS